MTRRVLVHLNSLELGGTQINAIDFAARLREHGWESSLVGPVPPEGPDVLPLAQERGLTIEPYDEPPTVLGHARVLRARADELGVDLVHAYGTWGAARPAYWGPCRWGRRPWLLTMYEMQLHESVHRHVPMVVGTEYLLEECADRPGATVLIRPPVDLDRDRPAAAPVRTPGAPVVLGLVSRLEEDIKSTAVVAAIGAVRRIRADVVLEVAGGGGALDRLRRLGDETNAILGRQAVTFLGPLPDPRPVYSRADVMLGMGGSAARALAHGKPLVAQGEAGWSAVLTPASAPALARDSYWSREHVEDAAGLLARNLEPLVADPALRDRLGAFSREFAERTFGLEEMTARLAELYDRAMTRYTTRSWVADLGVEARKVPEKAVRSVRELRSRHVGGPRR